MNTHELEKKADNLGVSEDVYIFLRQSNRKIRYFSCDLKREQIIIDGERVTFIPSREDSLERLEAEGVEFASEEKSVEDIVIESTLRERLREVLTQLDRKDRRLIEEIFYQEKSEDEIAKSLRITQQAVSKQKKKVLAKIRNLMKY